jgi:hypothetical protein
VLGNCAAAGEGILVAAGVPGPGVVGGGLGAYGECGYGEFGCGVDGPGEILARFAGG